MARPIWTGSLAFGLVNVPVSLFAATEDHGVHFHQLEAGTPDRIRYRRVNERTGEEVPRERIVRAVDVGDGEYVVVEDDELEAISPERSKVIEIADFVDLEDIDPVYYDTAYYLAPRGEAAARAYALLRAAMEETHRVGIALFVLRGRERVVAVRPDRDVLAMETMYFADEVRDPSSTVPDLPHNAQLGDRELKTACMLVDALSTEWDPERYVSTYRTKLHELIERKRHGETIRAPEEPSERPAKIVDLMEALDASLKASRQARESSEPSGEPSGRTAAPTGGISGGQGGRRSGAGGAPRSKSSKRASGAASSGARQRGQNLSELTKADLQAMAADLDVAGRSKMTRDELESAVRRASRRRAS